MDSSYPRETRDNRPDRRADAIGALLVFATAAALYAVTLAPGLAHSGGDGHELTVVAARLGLAHPSGYPLYTWIGHLFTRLGPIGDAAYRMNALSGLSGAAAVALVYLVARRLRLRHEIAAFTALLLGVSPTFWSQAVIAEVYTPNAAMVALVLWLLLRWADRIGERTADRAFVVFAAAYGLSIGMHMSNLLFAPAFASFAVLVDRPILRRRRTVALALAAFLAGTAQFAWLPLRAGAHDLFPNTPPDTPAAFYRYTLGAFADLRFAFSPRQLPDRFASYVALSIENFSAVGLALGFAGLWSLLRRDVPGFWLLALMYGLHVAFFSQLWVVDPDPYFIPSNLVFALLIGIAIDAIHGAVAPAERPGKPIGARLLLGILLTGALMPIAAASFRTNDRSGDTVLGDFHHAAFALLPPGSILVARAGAFGSRVAYFHDLLAVRPDVRVTDRRWRDLPPDAPVFTTPEPHPVGAVVRFPQGAWFVPALRGARHDAMLYRVLASPPPLVVRDAAPAVRVDRVLGDAMLVGYDAPVVADGRVDLKTYWRIPPGTRVIVTTQAGGVTLEAHELGFGNLPRYRAEHGFTDGGIVVEALGVAIPAALPAGVHPLRVGAIDHSTGTVTLRWVRLGDIRLP
jgi:hypothetical protein